MGISVSDFEDEDGEVSEINMVPLIDIMLVMLQHKRQDLSHFPVSAALLEQMLLKQPEGFWHLGKRGAVA